MSWERVKLKELLTIKNGKDHKSLKDGIYPVYGSGGIMRYADKYLYDKESILLPRKGTLNNIQFAKTPFWTVDTCYYTVVNTDRVVPYFLFRNLRQFDIEALNTGSAVPSMTFDKYYTIEINLPDLPTQKRIASILSAYDDLIEVNRKQIKLLEEAAERLYREWFIDLRFPGHETATFNADGLPEGWERKRLRDLFTFVRGRSYSSDELNEKEGVLFVNLKNIRPFGGYKFGAEKRYIGKYTDNQLLFDGDLVMGVTDMTKERRLVGRFALIPDFGETASFTMDLIKIEPFAIPKNMLYAIMQYAGYSNNAASRANGTNVLHLRPENILDITIPIPSTDLIIKYNDFFEGGRIKINALQRQIEKAEKARDLLLPKLMNGEIQL